MIPKAEFYRFLPEGVSGEAMDAELDEHSSSPHIVDLGPDPNFIQLPTCPSHIDVTLPTNTEIPESNDASKHAAASLDIPTIIFVHGLCSATELYHPMIQHAGLREKYRVVTYDIEGHARTPFHRKGGEIYAEKLVQTLKEVADWVGVDKFILIGHSVGGFIAASFALKHPERITKLILLAPANPMSPEDPAGPQWVGFLPLTLAQGVTPWAQYCLQYAFDPSNNNPSMPVIKAFAESACMQTPRKTLARYIITMFDNSPDYSKLRIGQEGGVDGLLIRGDFETGWPKGILSEAAVNIYKDAFKGREVRVPKTGHYLLIEDHVRVAEEVKKFLEAP